MVDLICDEYRRAWALRYSREAGVDLALARQATSIASVRDLSAIALRKTQLAIEYASGQPEYLDVLVSEPSLGRASSREPLLSLLLKIKAVMRDISDSQSPLNKETIVAVTETIVDASTAVIEAVIGEEA
jgi:hypothetical protein